MLVFSLLFAEDAFAASTTARIVLQASGNVELARKVRAEAEHVGILVASERGTTPLDDAELLQRHDAVGVVELASPDRVRIYVAQSGEHAAYRTVVERAPADGDGFALRIVEQLRGRLVELRLLPAVPESSASGGAPTKTKTETKPSSSADDEQRDDASRSSTPDARGPGGNGTYFYSPTLGLAVGGAATIASGGMGATPGVALGLRLEPSARWAATLHALLPVAENDIFAPEGEGSVRVTLIIAELGYRLAKASAPIQPEVGPGAGLVILSMESETVAPFEAHTDRLVAGIYFLQAGAGFALEPWLRLRAGMRAGLSAPRPVVRFDEREVAAWGRGFLQATLEAEFRLSLASGQGGP